MQTIEIKTTQNVVIEHELAPAGSRILAWIIDSAIYAIFIAIILYTVIIPLENSNTHKNVIILFFIFLTILYVSYDFIMELLNNGQTLGKMAAGIRVIKLDRSRSDVQSFMIRAAFRMIDINMSFGSFAFLFIISSPRRQRLGDLLAHTAVVKTESRMALSLSDLQRIDSVEVYSPRYPQVKMLLDEEVITIRLTLDRYRKKPSRANSEALQLLIGQLKKVLEIETITEKPEQFLKTLVKDYIVLTR